MILLSHPTANQNVRQAARALAEEDLLAEFWTGVHWKRDGLLDRAAAFSPRLRNELRRRSFSAELRPFLRTVPAREWGRLLAGQLGGSRLTRSETGPFSVDAVYRALDRRVAQRLADPGEIRAVYAYDDGALASFRAAKKRGLFCIYEHPIVYWRAVQQLQREEAELHPEWAPTLVALRDSEEKLARKDEELALADLVITPGTFARQSLASAPKLTAPIVVIPYGADSLGAEPIRREPAGKLRALFVGSLTQAKGLGYLLEAAGHLRGSVQLTLVGRRVSATMPPPAALAAHRWIPSLPHAELLQEMSRHDLLVLPSLHEGFGLVLGEAMSRGLAILTTPHSAGPDLMSEGREGFIVPIRSAEALEEKLALLARDRERLRAMQEAARARMGAFSWENYRQGILRMAREVMEKRAKA